MVVQIVERGWHIADFSILVQSVFLLEIHTSRKVRYGLGKIFKVSEPLNKRWVTNKILRGHLDSLAINHLKSNFLTYII